MDTLNTVLVVGGAGASLYGFSRGKSGHSALLAGAAALAVGLVRAARSGPHVVGAHMGPGGGAQRAAHRGGIGWHTASGAFAGDAVGAHMGPGGGGQRAAHRGGIGWHW